MPFLPMLALAALATTPNDHRMDWWREARFGMFIHWGLYSIPAGEWKGKTNYGEWLMEEAHVPVNEYEQLQTKFNPTKFDAKHWAKMARDAGMKYVVITTKHHDGFALYDSKKSPYNVMNTPFKRDIMRELSTAVRKDGLKMCWYHSIMDWHSPLYVPARPWNPTAGGQKNLDRYNEYLRSMVSELLTNYGPIGVMWFDGEWEASWDDRYGKPLYELCRQLQPDVIVNNRVSNSRAGSMESADGHGLGDFSTPEQYIPPTGLPGVDWETCMTMNDHWGWNKNDKNWKSSRQLIRNLVDVVSKGGNYLLNIGPEADGTFPPEAVERLSEIGKWMKVNSSSIYDTTASVFDSLPWGRSTTKRNGSHTSLYLQVFDWPTDGKLIVPGLGNDPVSLRLLGSRREGATPVAPRRADRLTWQRHGGDVVINVPQKAPNTDCSVIELKVVGAPIVYRAPRIVAPSSMLVGIMPIRIESGSPELEVRFTLDGKDPDASSMLYGGPVKIDGPFEIKAASFHHGKLVSPISIFSVKRAVLKPAVEVANVKAGLTYREIKGDCDRCADLAKYSSGLAIEGPMSFPKDEHGVALEYVGRIYEGYINAPEDAVYDFALTSDDGSLLFIDGEKTVDNDGLHSSETKSGQIALAKGLHKIRIEWFNKTGSAELRLSWAKAGEKLEPVAEASLKH